MLLWHGLVSHYSYSSVGVAATSLLRKKAGKVCRSSTVQKKHKLYHHIIPPSHINHTTTLPYHTSGQPLTRAFPRAHTTITIVAVPIRQHPHSQPQNMSQAVASDRPSTADSPPSVVSPPPNQANNGGIPTNNGTIASEWPQATPPLFVDCCLAVVVGNTRCQWALLQNYAGEFKPKLLWR